MLNNKTKENFLKIFFKYFLMMSFGGYVYVTLELLYRGRSAVSMMYCASLVTLVMILLNNIFTYEMDFLLQCIICTISCTGLEWIFGLLFNRDYLIWDYRGLPLSSPDGMVCFPFMLVWFIISFFAIPLLDYIEWKIFRYKPYTPPYYKIFNKKIFEFNYN